MSKGLTIGTLTLSAVSLAVSLFLLFRSDPRVKSLTIVDQKGNSRIVLQTLDGHPALGLKDASGVDRVLVSVLGGPRLSLLDRQGRPEISIYEEPSGRLVLHVESAKDGSSVRIGVQDDGRPKIVMSQKEDVLWSAPQR